MIYQELRIDCNPLSEHKLGRPSYFPGGIIELERAKRTDIFYPTPWQKMTHPWILFREFGHFYVQNLTSWRWEMCYLILDFYIFYKLLSLEGINGAVWNFFLSILGKQN